MIDVSHDGGGVRLNKFVYREKSVYRRLRRCLDLLGSLAVLPIALPLIAGAAIAIKCEDGGPIMFVQKRVGRYGKLFNIYKLRTMRIDACGSEPSPTSSQDSRVTSVGRLLRKLSIDELPQLINVLIGDMSLVGPRPEQPFHVLAYAEQWQQLRFIVTPGITGLWQVHLRKTVQLNEPAATALDLEYASKASTVTDLKILVKTFLAILSPTGVY